MPSETTRTRVKVCGLTRVDDLRAAIAAGVDAIGLVFYSASPRSVGVEQARQLVHALPPFVTAVGLFVDPEPDWVRTVCAAVPLDLLQFHGEEAPGFCGAFGRPYIKAVRVRAGIDLRAVAASHAAARGLLLDAYVPGQPGGTGERFDWNLIPAEPGLPVVLAGGLGPGNVAEAIRRVRPYAVDVSSGVEQGKGIKDAAKIAAFIRGVESADRES